jgi:hypothetical protein
MKLSDLNILDVGNTIQLVGAVYADKDRIFLCMMPNGLSEDQDTELNCQLNGVASTRPVKMLYMDAADWEKFLRQTDLLETEILEAAGPNKEIVKAITRKLTRQISQDVSWKVFRRDGMKCRYCAAADVPLTVDHLVLWEHGGPSIEANLVSACKRCNKFRGNTEYADWLVSPQYKGSSKKLDEATRQKNLALVNTLSIIPRRLHNSSR